MKRILVFGADGYLGKHLVKTLIQTEKNACIIPAGKSQCNLRNLKATKMYLLGQDIFDEIYQFAANSGNIDYLMSEKYLYGDNTLININIIKALNRDSFKGKILFPSSFYAADAKNRYGLEKLFNEALYLESGLNVRIPRLFSVYGPGEKLNSSGEKVATAFCRKVIEAEEKETLLLDATPFSARYFLHIEDAIRGFMAHMKSDVIECDIAGSYSIPLDQLINTIIKVSKKDIRIFWSHDGYTTVFHPHPNRLEWQPMTGFEYGIEELYRWVENELS